MDWEVILKVFGLITFGTLFVWRGIDAWRHRREERINLIEAAILKVGGEEEPLPRNRWDHMMADVQPILMLLFGPAMIFLGFVILFV